MKAMLKVALATVAVAGPALAHHSTTGWSRSETMEITGTIKEFQFQNPHSWIQVYVPNEDGELVEWSVEWGIPNSLLRQGYNRSTFPEGAEVTIRLRPAVSGAPAGGFVAAQFPDGRTVGNWDGAGGAPEE